jgi:hypothetical protein
MLSLNSAKISCDGGDGHLGSRAPLEGSPLCAKTRRPNFPTLGAAFARPQLHPLGRLGPWDCRNPSVGSGYAQNRRPTGECPFVRQTAMEIAMESDAKITDGKSFEKLGDLIDRGSKLMIRVGLAVALAYFLFSERFLAQRALESLVDRIETAQQIEGGGFKLIADAGVEKHWPQIHEALKHVFDFGDDKKEIAETQWRRQLEHDIKVLDGNLLIRLLHVGQLNRLCDYTNPNSTMRLSLAYDTKLQALELVKLIWDDGLPHNQLTDNQLTGRDAPKEDELEDAKLEMKKTLEDLKQQKERQAKWRKEHRTEFYDIGEPRHCYVMKLTSRGADVKTAISNIVTSELYSPISTEPEQKPTEGKK